MLDLQTIPPTDRKILRDLAKRQQEIANLDIMKEREKAWYLHNDLSGGRPMVTFETWTCEAELLPPLVCTTASGREIELEIRRELLSYEQTGDDRVVRNFYPVTWKMQIRNCGLDIIRNTAKDTAGREIGYRTSHPISDPERDLPLKGSTIRTVDKRATIGWMDFVSEVLGDILPVRLIGSMLEFGPIYYALEWMGTEALMFSLADNPEAIEVLLQRITEELHGTLDWQEREGLLLPNDGNDLLLQGSFGFSHKLREIRELHSGMLTTQQQWGYMDTEIAGVSPAMLRSMLLPLLLEAAKRFGFVSFGCCEPVHLLWENGLDQIKNLRKISVAPWTDGAYMGEVLRGKPVIFHRKPPAAPLSLEYQLDEQAYRTMIRETIRCATGCHLEFSLRDVYTFKGNPGKAAEAVRIIREELS